MTGVSPFGWIVRVCMPVLAWAAWRAIRFDLTNYRGRR